MKNPRRLLCLAALVVSFFAPCASRAADAVSGSPHHTFVLVHGATGGGWSWKTIDRLLTADGHLVYRPTLTGLGDRVHLASPDINLTTHVNDVVNLILYEDLRDVVLVGFSYGGMVITGVMDRVPERIAHAVFLDAAAPDDGMCALDLWGPLAPEDKIVNGQVNFSWLDTTKPVPHGEPQSLKTFTEPVSFKNPAAWRLAATYVAFLAPGQTAADRANDPSWQHAEARGWTMRTMESDHNAPRSHPKELVALLETTLNDRNRPRP